jgi:hypothetical protein
MCNKHLRPMRREPERRVFPSGGCPGSAANQRFARRPRAGAHPRGAVIVIVLLATLLLGGVLCYVMDMGQQVNNRIVTQHAADAAAVAAGGWIAREFNTIAGDNVGIAKLLAAVNVLDSVPLATQITLQEDNVLAPALANSLNIAIAGPQGASWVRAGLQQLYNGPDIGAIRHGMIQDIAYLTPIDQLFNHSGYDVTQMTFYNAPSGGQGEIWRAMTALDQYSQAAAADLGVLTTLNSVRGGQANLAGDCATVLIPALPTIPTLHGRFDDFERPVRHGLLPGAAGTNFGGSTEQLHNPAPAAPIGQVDNPLTNRGPCDTEFGWRTIIMQGGTSQTIKGTSDPIAGSGHNDTGLGGAPFSNDTSVQITPAVPVGYSVYGFQTAALSGVYGSTQLWRSDWNRWLSTLANIKLSYLWPLPGTPAGIQQIVNPQWTIGYPQAVALANQNPGQVYETCLAYVSIRSKVPIGDASFLAPGTWAYENGTDTPDGRLRYVRGWLDPATWTARSPNVTQVGNYDWRDCWQYQVNQDTAIGVTEQKDPKTNNPIPQTVYRIDDYVFIGACLGPQIPVRNPYQGFDPGAAGAPAPTDIDRTQIPVPALLASGAPGPASTTLASHLTLVAATRQADTAILWPTRFTGNKPYANMVALAKVIVFNNHSWDLWTQMWAAQMVPVQAAAPGNTDYADLVSTMQASLAAVSNAPSLSARDYTNLQTYLTNLTPLAQQTLLH